MGGSASSARGAGSPTEKLTLLEGGGERGGGVEGAEEGGAGRAGRGWARGQEG